MTFNSLISEHLISEI